jgi:general secretion pathway protein A
MYEKYWGLREKPFQNTPNPRFVFYSDSHEEALVRMLYTVTESKGLMLLLGEHGVGKSFTCHVFSREIQAKGYPVGFLRAPAQNPDEFLSQVLYEFGLPAQGAGTRSQKLQRIQEASSDVARTGRELVLIVDEAQALADPATLGEVRNLLNLAGEDRFLITVILSGTPELWARVIEAQGMRQRVGVSYRILPFSRAETEEYVLHRLTCAGREQPAFDADALDAIQATTRGVPREINTLCDLCLLIGSGEDVDIVKPALVERAVEEMSGARSGNEDRR